MGLSRSFLFVLFSLLVLGVNWARSDNDDHGEKKPYDVMHNHYDDLGNKDGLVSYDEIKRALGKTNEDEWIKEIAPHDDGDKLLDVLEFKNWLTSFRKDEL